MEFDVIKSNDLQVLANTVKTYLQGGWVLRGELVEQNGSFAQEVTRHPVKRLQPKKVVQRQRSWISWSKPGEA